MSYKGKSEWEWYWRMIEEEEKKGGEENAD